MKYVPPSVRETAFNCPHCGALAKQYWFSVHADPKKKDATPLIIDAAKLDELKLDHIEEPEERTKVKKWVERMGKGRPFLEPNQHYRDMGEPKDGVRIRPGAQTQEGGHTFLKACHQLAAHYALYLPVEF